MKIKITDTLKKAWLDNLSSGKFAKGKFSLRSGNRYCCLGVLAETAGLEIDENYDTIVGDDVSNAPATFRYKVFRDALGSDVVSELIEANDTSYSFEKAIEIIEKLDTSTIKEPLA